MSSIAFLIYPHQLFEELTTHPKNTIFYLLEDPLYFTQYSFHQQKIMFHRASMKYFADLLIKKNYTVHYLETNELKNYGKLIALLQQQKPDVISYYATTDDWLERKIKSELAMLSSLQVLKSPMFLSDRTLLEKHFREKKHFSMASFYMQQRKNLGLLMNGTKPAGGKWSLDEENRKKLPRQHIPPFPLKLEDNKWKMEAKKYTKQFFEHHYGSSETFHYGVTHAEAKQCLQDFLENRFALFGPYEDAISKDQVYIYHSVLSPYLNTGLLLPEEVIDAVMSYGVKHAVPLNSLEGFIRQVIGWREFMLGLYVYHGRKERTSNFYKHERKLPESFWKGTTGIEPVDTVIRKVHDHAYSHHIERLMVMGNFMLLCEINPHDIYRWFMEFHIDAYDWVMVPNVYSMSQFASGGTATTKPYLSGSNYILKMSDYKKGPWCEIWDALYWRFIDKHKAFFKQNPRLSAMTFHLDKMSEATLLRHHEIAEDFLKNLNH
ncbi:MAG: cryptochrome/photolyase family protein [Cytophagaceae bacterium]|nr:cryptochrome/photolyase family protein [Cytophagaceae bacterium]